jgi:hypothetical protein
LRDDFGEAFGFAFNLVLVCLETTFDGDKSVLLQVFQVNLAKEQAPQVIDSVGLGMSGIKLYILLITSTEKCAAFCP